LATVITNLMSAIPWIGQDIVEFLWGGLNTVEPHYGDVVLKILLNAGTSSILVFGYVFINKSVKKPNAWGKSAGVKEISSLEASQRLNAESLIYAYLVGLFEGDGFFSVSRCKKGKYFQCEIGIELGIKDVQLIYKVKDMLGVGTVGFTSAPRERGQPSASQEKVVYLRISKKDHLIKYIFPIFDRYPMFSNKQYDYIRLKQTLLSNIVLYDNIPDYTRPFELLNDVDSILKADYFSAWLVGFIEAQGCFSVYKLNKTSDYSVASFDISQTNGEILIMAIAKHLSLPKVGAATKIYKDKTDNFKLKVTSVRSIENVVSFLKKAPLKLLGNKKLRYLLFIKTLRTIKRYSEKINIPSKY